MNKPRIGLLLLGASLLTVCPGLRTGLAGGDSSVTGPRPGLSPRTEADLGRWQPAPPTHPLPGASPTATSRLPEIAYRPSVNFRPPPPPRPIPRPDPTNWAPKFPPRPTPRPPIDPYDPNLKALEKSLSDYWQDPKPPQRSITSERPTPFRFRDYDGPSFVPGPNPPRGPAICVPAPRFPGYDRCHQDGRYFWIER